MSPIELAIIVGGFALRFSGWRLLQYRSGRPTDTSKYSADLQAAISLRTDRTDKTVADIRTIVQKQS